MKTIILSLTIAALLQLNIHAQGTIKFANSASSLVTTNDFNGHLGPAASASFRVALYWGVSGSNPSTFVQIGTNGPGTNPLFIGGLNPALPGRFSDARVYVTGNTTAPSGVADFQVKAWVGNYTSYEAALAGAQSNPLAGVGVSAVFSGHVGGGGTPPELPGSITGFSGLSIYVQPQPEPSTFVLAGFGSLILFSFRRRN